MAFLQNRNNCKILDFKENVYVVFVLVEFSDFLGTLNRNIYYCANSLSYIVCIDIYTYIISIKFYESQWVGAKAKQQKYLVRKTFPHHNYMLYIMLYILTDMVYQND